MIYYLIGEFNKKSKKKKKIRNKLTSSYFFFFFRKYAAPLIQQGFGLVNATRLLDTKTLITSDPIFELGLSMDLSAQFEVTLFNGNDYSVEYTLTHNPGVTVITKRPDDKIFGYMPPFSHKFAKVSGSGEKFTLEANSGKNISLIIEAPTSLSHSYGPVYQGKLLFEGDNGEQVSSAYIGTYADSYKCWSLTQKPLLLSDGIERATVVSSENNNNFTISNGQDGLFYTPILIGATQLDVALVDESFNMSNISLPIFPGQPGVVNLVDTFPMSILPRSTNGAFSLFQVTGTNSITDGVYRVLSAILPAIPYKLPNETAISDWQTFLSAPFNFIFDPEPNAVPDGTVGRFNSSIFTSVEISSLNSNSSQSIYPYDSIGFTVSISITDKLVKGSKTNMTLPEQFTNFPPAFPVYNDVGVPVLEISINNDTNVMSVTVINDWGVVYITGDVIFTAWLKNPEQYTRNEQVPLTFRKTDMGQANVVMLDIMLMDPDFPSIRSWVYDDSEEGMINVYVPPSFKDWSDMEIAIVSEYSFECSQVQVEQLENFGSERSLSSSSSEQSTDIQTPRKTIMYKDYYNMKCNNNFVSISIPEAHSASSSNNNNNNDENNQGIQISIPVKTSNIVVNSPLSGLVRCNLSGSPFSYYMNSVLNSLSLRSNSMALTGRRE